MSSSRPGRPRASSREVIAEAACELFFEQGYDATSISDITRRAGVARSSFFNYFAAKGDVLWAGFDGRMDAAAAALESGATVETALVGIGAGFEPDALALAITNAETMGLMPELERDRALRQRRLQREIATRLIRGGEPPLAAEVRAGAHAAAVLAAVWAWAESGP
ncbi:MAG: TetR/AcrR family transcriptional regulator, partial [Microbacterium sp.]|uniref:TetR/AcrR family transcriptional regulator n=1 Tax=Microbacterium sp. TaxID=51671 RepID=UPI0039E64772